jgi:hypothetical protein
MTLLETDSSTLVSVLYGLLGVGACVIGVGLPIWIVVWLVLRYRKNMVAKQVPGSSVSPNITRNADPFDMEPPMPSLPAPTIKDPYTADAKSADAPAQTDQWGSIFDDPAEQPQWGFDETEWTDPDEEPENKRHP